MLRTITLSLLMLISVVIMLPFASSTAHGIRQSSAQAQSHRRFRRHSRAWWRRHRARVRFRRAAALAHRNSPLGPVFANSKNPGAPAPEANNLPAGWDNATLLKGGEVKFATESNATIPSQGTLAVVARSRPNPGYLTQREQRTMLAGTSFSDLRRIAIDKMINAGGWVVNDYERNVNGSRVFVVVAQTPSDGRSPEKSWNFYFAEVDGKIYSLTLNTSLQYSDKLSAEGERFLSTLKVKADAGAQPAGR
jgi:hypothetical protein